MNKGHGDLGEAGGQQVEGKVAVVSHIVVVTTDTEGKDLHSAA